MSLRSSPRGLAQISLEDPEHMRTLAEQAAEELADAPAEEIIRWATDTFGDRICITSSMTDAVIVHLASAVQPGIDVVFLDTGYHFAETIGTRDAAEAVYPVTPDQRHPVAHRRRAGRRARPAAVRAQPRPVLLPAQGRAAGAGADQLRRLDHRRAPRRDQRAPPDPGRRVGRPREMVKVNPIAAGRQKQVDAYIAEQRRAGQPAGLRRLPLDRLRDLHRVESGADPRSGRWAGTGKTECGIHA